MVENYRNYSLSFRRYVYNHFSVSHKNHFIQAISLSFVMELERKNVGAHLHLQL